MYKHKVYKCIPVKEIHFITFTYNYSKQYFIKLMNYFQNYSKKKPTLVKLSKEFINDITLNITQ